jgi:hypothetical protein
LPLESSTKSPLGALQAAQPSLLSQGSTVMLRKKNVKNERGEKC